MSEDRLQELIDHRDICQLKHSFGRLADAKDWDAFAALFTEDATFDLGAGQVMQGGAAYAAAVAGMLEGAVSIHRFLMPEITFHSPTEANGIWMINDYNEWPSDPETGERCAYKAYGREYETYRKVDGKWKIASWRLRYDRLDPAPRAPLARHMMGGPAALRDDAYLSAVVNPRGT